MIKTEATMPRLPEGYYWDISDGPTGREYPYVSIVEKRRWWFDKHVIGRWSSSNEWSTLAAKVEFIADTVHNEWVNQRKIARERKALTIKENK